MRQHLLFSKTSIALIVFMVTMIFFSYQVSHSQLDSPNNINNSTSINNTSSSFSSNNSSTNNLTNPLSLVENGNVSFGSYSSFVNDINSFLASSSSKSISNSTTNSQTETPSSNLLSLHEITIQNTSMSVPAPVRHPGQTSHEVVFALPLRNDGKIWSGTVTFTASKPIEVEVLHAYAPLKNPDSTHGEPYHAVLPGNNSIAITHLRNLVDVPIEINGTGMSSGTLDFAGNALVFHKTSGELFTVTYTIDAVSF
jgi:uncharacterized protein with beta-barrel porin domain